VHPGRSLGLRWFWRTTILMFGGYVISIRCNFSDGVCDSPDFSPRCCRDGRYESACFVTLYPRVPSRRWREQIKKVWEVDPLVCPRCSGEMEIIALIHDDTVIEKILRYLALWPEPAQGPARSPPEPEHAYLCGHADPWRRPYEPFYDERFTNRPWYSQQE